MLRYAMYVTMSISSYILEMHFFGISFISSHLLWPLKELKNQLVARGGKGLSPFVVLLAPKAANLAGRQPQFVLSRLADPQKFRLSRELAEKNIRLSRRENCGLNTKQFITKVVSILKLIAYCHDLLCHPSSVLLCCLCVYA